MRIVLALIGSGCALCCQTMPLPARLDLAPQGTTLRKPVQPHHFLEAVGRRGAMLGTEDGTFEAWLNPIKCSLATFGSRCSLMDLSNQ
jgi:hypothetical protein